MFKHYLLCRYNCGLYSSNPYNIENPNGWMEDRLPKFIRLCKSLKAQTNQNFQLIVSLDADTPIHYISDIFLNAPDTSIITDSIPMDLIKNNVIDSPWLITSRIDNDDEYYPDFIETIQSEFKEVTEVLDVQGVQYDGENYYTSGRATPNSPFISLIEPSNKPQTAHIFSHSQMNRKFKARFVGDKPLYIQHIHNNNVMNKIIGKKICG